LAALLALSLVAGGCSAPTAEGPSRLDDAPNLVSDEPPLAGKADAHGAPLDARWIYNGPMPPLDEATLVVAIEGHTVRITGLVPDGWQRPLPPYAIVEPDAGRQRVHVVYPIATADVEGGSSNATAGDYSALGGPVFTPSNVNGKGVRWGGFPYLQYDHQRFIALHGPITWVEGNWTLLRGRVSHGCNRMAGEHIVELAHILGMDMTVPHLLEDELWVGYADRPVVRVVEQYDSFDGLVVDVDYPAGPGFVRPTAANVMLFPTWSSDDAPDYVCAYDPTLEPGSTHCSGSAAPYPESPAEDDTSTEPQ
jgi:hypothetical protein